MSLDKSHLRTQMKIIQKSISGGDRRAATKALADVGVDFLTSGGSRVIAGYIPRGEEITPLLLMQELYHRQAPLALPRWSGEGDQARFYRWWPGERLQPAQQGLFEPLDTEREVAPEYLMVPTLGFDRQGNRLGFGQDNYSRLIKTLRARLEVIVVGVAFAELELPMPLEDNNDGDLDWVLTQHGIRRTMAH